MSRIEIILYVIILGLIINLIANMIWKYIPGTDKHLDKIVSFALIFVCVLLVIFHKDGTKSAKESRQITSEPQVGSQSTGGIQSPSVIAGGSVTITNIMIDGKNLPISSEQIRQGAENILKTASVGQGEPKKLSKDEVKKLTEGFGLLKETRTNPHLSFLGGDIAYWYEQELSEDRLKLEFAARKVVLDAADKQGVVIDDQGKLSWAAQRIMANILKERAALAQDKGDKPQR